MTKEVTKTLSLKRTARSGEPGLRKLKEVSNVPVGERLDGQGQDWLVDPELQD